MSNNTKTFDEILKFNPYHDRLGRFTTSGGASSFTYAPGKSKAHDNAIQNEKQTSKGFKGTLYHGSPETDIEEFDIGRAGKNTSSGEKLIYFTDSKQMADDFSYERLEGSTMFTNRRGKKGRVYEVDVEMKNPLDFRNLSDKDIDNILKLDIDGILTKDMVKLYAQKNHQLLKSGLEITSESLKSLGYDGLIASTGKAGHNSLEYAVVDSKQAKIRKSVSTAKSARESVLFIGLQIGGADALAIQGGEETEDFHVTLIYGHFDPKLRDSDAIDVCVQSAIDEVRENIPDKIKFDAIKRFPASESSDGKDVIYAQVAAGQLEQVRKDLLKALKENHIDVKDTFPEYKPHMTLAYIDQGEEYELSEINETGTVKRFMIGHGYESSHENEYTVMKTDDDKRLVFGWASISITVDGEQLEDRQQDMIDPEDLEEAAYEYVLNFRDTGEEHISTMRKKGKLVESCVFTAEKQKAMGIPEGTIPVGWWIGFKIDDDAAWEKVKNGTYRMFSIEGRANREPVEKHVPGSNYSTHYMDYPSYDMWLEENLEHATIEEQKAAKEYFSRKRRVAKSFNEILEATP